MLYEAEHLMVYTSAGVIVLAKQGLLPISVAGVPGNQFINAEHMVEKTIYEQHKMDNLAAALLLPENLVVAYQSF